MEKQNMMETRKQENEKTNEKNSKNPWILVGGLSCLAIILLAIILTYIVYRQFKRSGEKELLNEINASLYNQNIAMNESATLPADAFYKNRIYNFSLSYPLDWWHEQSKNGDGVSMSPEVQAIDEFNDRQDQIVGVVAYGWRNTEGLTLEQFLEQNEAGNNQIYANYMIDEQSNVQIGNLEAIRLDKSYQVDGILMKKISIYHLDSNSGLALITTCPEDKWQKYQVVIDKIIQSFRAEEIQYNQNVTESDTNQIMEIAQNFVQANAVLGMEFSLNLDKQTNEWARLTAIPTGEQKADEAMVLLHKEDGTWVVKDFGTDLSQWYDQTPDGFWD